MIFFHTAPVICPGVPSQGYWWKTTQCPNWREQGPYATYEAAKVEMEKVVGIDVLGVDDEIDD